MRTLYDLLVLALAIFSAFYAIQGNPWGIVGFIFAGSYLIEESLRDLRRAPSKLGWWAGRIAAASLAVLVRKWF